MDNSDFFEESTEQSKTKAQIVSDYLWAWAQVIIPSTKKYDNKIAYIDLFAGTGRYKDGTKSTPLLVLERAVKDTNMRNMLETVFKVTQHERMLLLPLTWRKPKQIFVNSMSDIFHEDISDDFILKVFDVMKKAHWHRFQVLTKRSERMLSLSDQLPWASNIWMGVSIENSDYLYRIDALLRTGAFTKFLSIEPLLGSVNGIKLVGIDWVIAGGESGPYARPMEALWVNEVLDNCLDKEVPFFFKQWGGVNKKKTGRTLDGRTWDQMPVPTTSLLNIV